MSVCHIGGLNVLIGYQQRTSRNDRGTFELVRVILCQEREGR